MRLSDLKLIVKQDSPDKPEYGEADLLSLAQETVPEVFKTSYPYLAVTLRIYPKTVTVAWEQRDMDAFGIGLCRLPHSYFKEHDIKYLLCDLANRILSDRDLTRWIDDDWDDDRDWDEFVNHFDFH